ncbi:DMT family transporter [Aquicoccus sp. G2-2]|uniref:DMT family transporter n=1 Tax=Aquicoccus sp. G2-2 TaxID=3092120 RepID=UPI002ADF0AD4|nr:DMT family transporter [Aquicoccus sp. G2-2]MEA1114113.1 DMT family transporter [Aquicoccus sp. G2-2]
METRDNMKGAGLMIVSMAAFTFNDVCVKALAGEVPLMQVIFLRGLLSSLLIWFAGRQMRALHFRISARDWRLILLRSAADVGATFSYLTALFHMPIANVTAILQVLPLTVTLAAALFLAEPLGWRRLIAIAVGLAGVMLIVKPGTEGFDYFSLYALLGVGFITVRDLAARRLSRDVPSISAALLNALAVTLAAGVGSVLGSEGWVGLEAHSLLLIVMAASFILCGYLSAVAVMRVGEISFTAPFRYTGLLWALLLGYVVFGDFPGNLTLLGAVIVVVTGIFTLLREARLRRRKAQPVAKRARI